uniref:Uncharacterized protein n=1 Tax=Arundo donax TaxID=35708 RepID=A0A0A9FXS9_ARUDO
MQVPENIQAVVTARYNVLYSLKRWFTLFRAYLTVH